MEKEELEANFKIRKDQINLILNTFELSEAESFELITEKVLKNKFFISKVKFIN